MTNPFLHACGATGPLLLNTESPGVAGGETRAYDLPFVLAGGDHRSDLRLSHPEVSDRHAYLQLVDGQLLYIDLGSRSGVYQGGKRQRLGYLERDQAVRIGPFRVRLIGGDSGGATPVEAPCPPLLLDLSHRSVRHTRCDLPRGLALIGNAADCQIRLVDPSVSNYHCSLVRTTEGVWVVDLLGQGGVRVNGQEVAYAQLHEGDALQIGHSVIRLITGTDVSTPAAYTQPVAVARVVESTAPLSHRVVDPESPAQHAESEAASLVERVIGPMVSQVGLLQQQMVAEFHEAREMLFNSFATLHQEQTDFMNRELEQLRELSQELQALRDEIHLQNRRSADHAMPIAPPLSFPSRPSAATPPRSQSVSSGRAAEQSEAGHYTPVQVEYKGHTVGRVRSPGSFTSGTENVIIRAHNEQAHAKLCARIAKLKKKQQSRWERLLSMFPGTGSGSKKTLPENPAGSTA